MEKNSKKIIASTIEANKKNHIIKINGLNKWYGDFHALKNINLNINKSECMVICGPSGSGKSTLIRCINYLEQFQQGSIEIDGIALEDDAKIIAEIRSEVGMVFQSFNLFPHLSVLDNLILAPMWVKKQSRAAAIELAMYYLDRVGIAEQARKFPGQLSGGQQQRVAIARTLSTKPKVVLFDEPTSALDPEMIAEVLDVMVGMAKDGVTMVCVTHEMGFAKKVASQVIYMDDGQIVEQNDSANFFANPESESLQNFLCCLLD